MRITMHCLRVILVLLMASSVAHASTEVEGEGYTLRLPDGYKKVIDSCEGGG